MNYEGLMSSGVCSVVMFSVAQYLFIFCVPGEVGLTEEHMHGLAFLIGIEISL